MTLRYWAGWWESRRSGWPGIGQDILEGVCAYAVQQANAHHWLAMHFVHMWDMVYVPPDEDDYESDDDDVHP